VVAMFSCTEHMQAVLDLMWKHLVPAMGPSAAAASPEDAALARRLARLSLPTAAERRGGRPPEVPAMTFGPRAPSRTSQRTSHRTVSSIETVDGRMVIHEDDRSLEVPLTEQWTVVDSALAASATLLGNGRLLVDLVFLESPHRLEIELRPSKSTFAARWPIVPLFGAGIDNRLAAMRAPAG
jgi:hypothetical protein